MDRQPLLGFPLGTTLLQPTTIGRRTKTTTYAVAASDNAYEIVATTGTWTLTLPAPSAGFWIIFQNTGTGNITLSPASGTIDGLSSYLSYPNEARLINSDGSNYFSIVLNSFSISILTTTTITVPPGYARFTGIAWGGGASGSATAGGSDGGGGGGAAVPFDVSLAAAGGAGASLTATIGAGGAGVSATSTGNVGGNTTLGALVTAYGGGTATANNGGGGGGALSNGGSTGIGGRPNSTSLINTLQDNEGFGGGNSNTSTASNGNSAWGGAAGGCSNGVTPGGKSIYGGGGGGGPGGTGGSSVFGGAGSAGVSSGASANAAQPGGGSGVGATASGNGGAGQVNIKGVI